MSKYLTGEQVLIAFNEGLRLDKEALGAPYTMIPIRTWSDLYPREKRIYEGMAEYLNRLLGLKPEQAEQEGKP